MMGKTFLGAEKRSATQAERSLGRLGGVSVRVRRQL
jgi:hypothetical protein